MSEEALEPTNNEKIFVAKPLDITIDMVNKKLSKLKEVIKMLL